MFLLDKLGQSAGYLLDKIHSGASYLKEKSMPLVEALDSAYENEYVKPFIDQALPLAKPVIDVAKSVLGIKKKKGYEKS
jgi:hypothetical protein